MTTSSGLVWYAAYGSNLHEPRFRCYLTGGRAAGSARVHPPCADDRSPRATAVATLPFPLFFAGSSRTWGGGNAYIDPDGHDAATRARLYLISVEQFEAVVAAEGHRAPAPLPPPRAGTPATYRVASGDYGVGVLACGQLEGIPVLSVTGPTPDASVTPPRRAYLRTIASGLRHTHALSPQAVADYLAPVPGIASHYPHDDLVAVAEQGAPTA